MRKKLKNNDLNRLLIEGSNNKTGVRKIILIF